MSKEKIPVFFSADDNYAPYLATALVSLMDNANRSYDYDLVVLNDDLSEGNRERIGAMQRDGFRIRFVPMKAELEKMMEKTTNRLRCDYFTLTIYFRLFIPEMFPEYEKGLYVDSDIVIPGDISKLYHEDLHGKPIGACIDFSIQDVPPLTRYIDEAVGVDHTKYVNSGVLLMDLHKLRKMKFSEHFLDIMNRFRFDSIAPDQDYINAMLAGEICFLDNSWDLFPEKGKPEAEDPGLIHYNLFAKPWCYRDLPYEGYFWKYAAETDYYEEIKDNLNSYSEEKQKQDSENMQMMAVRGLEIVESGVRFSDHIGRGHEEELTWLHQTEEK